jgi:hypothetical protein
MTKRITTLSDISIIRILRMAVLSSLVMAAPLFAAGQSSPGQESLLVLQVREATRQFIDVNNAEKAGYAPVFGCVTGQDHGAMGIHYVNSTLVGDGLIEVFHPEALIYEPEGNARRLVGVEYIVDAATWLAAHDNTPPVLDDQDFQLVPSPNRFNLPTFFELHVWAWRNNPNGAFVDWNNNVTCEGQ